MGRPLDQVRDLSISYSCPVVCAGDIFDRWNPPPELINFALDRLPHLYAVPGQHDLPLHSYEDMHKGAYHTLVRAGKVTHLVPGAPTTIYDLRLHGFPWGFEVTPLEEPHDLLVELAVVHAYCWKKDRGYQGAPEGKKTGAWKPKLRGFDAAVFGDNHNPFCVALGEGSLMNTGGLMRRKSDETHQPGVGLLLPSGKIRRVDLDTSLDVCLGEGEVREVRTYLGAGAEDLLSELSDLSDGGLDFAEYARRQSQSLPPEVRKIILRALEA